MNKDKSKCDETSGKLVPIINLSNCGDKEDCIPACPYDVLEIRTITAEDRLTLNFKGKLKTFFKPKKAYVKPQICVMPVVYVFRFAQKKLSNLREEALNLLSYNGLLFLSSLNCRIGY